MAFEAQDKQKNEMLDIMDEAWISFLLNLFYSNFFVLVVSPAKLLESLILSHRML